MRSMKLGLQLGYWGSGPPPNPVEHILEAERLGYDSVWTAESYGSDALTPLVLVGVEDEPGSSRAPPLPALRTHSHRDGHGRVDHRPSLRRPVRPRPRCLRPSGRRGLVRPALPQTPGPDAEYVTIVRDVLRREAPVDERRSPLSPPHPGGSGLGKPLKSIVHPLRNEIPIILGAEGPKNVALAAEIADGWFPIWFSPREMKTSESALDEGFARPGARRSREDFEVLAFTPTVIMEDVEKAADLFRPFLALYIGGMGAREMNFHYDLFVRMGYEAEAARIQSLYLDGHQAEAIASVPTAMVEDVALIGPVAKIRDDLEAWRESIATSLLVNGDVATLRTMAELVL